jgi:hypothetical protein
VAVNPFLTPQIDWDTSFPGVKDILSYQPPPPPPAQIFGLSYKSLYPLAGYTKAWLIATDGRAVAKRRIPPCRRPRTRGLNRTITFLVKDSCTISHILLCGRPDGEKFLIPCGNGPMVVSPHSTFEFHLSLSLW